MQISAETMHLNKQPTPSSEYSECRRHAAASNLPLSPAELVSYRKHGFLTRQRVFSEWELSGLRAAVEKAVNKASIQAQTGKTYFLDGKRFVDVGSMTVQYEFSSAGRPDQLVGSARHYGTQAKPDMALANSCRPPAGSPAENDNPGQSQAISQQQSAGSPARNKTPDHLNGDTIRVIEPVHQLDPVLDELIRDPRITEPVGTILGTHALAIWTCKLNLKRGGSGSGFGWHQDSPYWIHDSDHVDLLPNVYLALDDATEANGCLRVIDGSHRQGCLPGRDDGTQLGGFFTDLTRFSEADQVLLEVPAGSLVFFDPHLVHGSRPNTTDQPRRALVATYQPAGYPTLKTGEIVDV